jgi:glucose/arabinose dehydrogenase
MAFAPFLGSAQATTVALGNDPRIAADGVQLGVFADGLQFPMGIIQLPDGSLLVASSDPTGGGFFSSTGSLLRLTDHDGDGRADSGGTALAENIPGPLVALQRAGNLIFVTTAISGGEAIYAYRRGDTWHSPLTKAAEIDFAFSGAEHQTYSLAVRKTPSDPKRYDLFFNVGAHGNDESGVSVPVSGAVSGDLEDASLYMTTVTDDGSSVSFTPPEEIARGLRNAAAVVFARGSGDLIISDNGIDTPDNPTVALSADELDVIPAAKIGGEVEDFGFPSTYVDYATGETVGSGGIAPQIAYTPIDGSENEGIASLAQMPPAFPADLRDGYIAGFHGQFDETGGGNEENPLVWVDLQTGDRFQLIANDNPEVGHLDSLLATDDALYVVDLCATGSLSAAAPCGVIYRITATGPQGSPVPEDEGSPVPIVSD